MARKKVLLILLALLFTATTAYVLLQLTTGRKGARQREINPKVDSVNLHLLTFDKENRKALEIWAQESRKVTPTKLLLKGVRAIVFKKGELTEDLTVEADEGSATTDFIELEISGQARIHSPRLQLTGPKFKLFNMEFLNTTQACEFRFDEVSGKASRGVDFFLKQKDVKAHDVEGRFVVSGKEYWHREKEFIFIHQERLIVLEEVDYLRSSGTVTRANLIRLELDQNYDKPVHSITVGKSYIFSEKTEERKAPETREIHVDIVETFHDDQGRVQKMLLRGGWDTADGTVVLTRGKTRTEIVGSAFDLFFLPDSEQLSRVYGQTCRIDHQGRGKFRFSSQRASMKMDEKGDLDFFSGEFGCRLEWGKVKGSSHDLLFLNRRSQFILRGDPARIEREGSVFLASEFSIDTQLRQLNTTKGVSATLAPQPRGQARFFRNPAYVVAQRMNIDERKNTLMFQQGVKVVQEGLEARGDRFSLVTQNQLQTLHAQGKVSFQFRSGQEFFTLKGENVLVPAVERKIEASAGAILEGGGKTLRAERIRIQLTASDEIESVEAWERVQFRGEEVEGSCENLKWDYRGVVLLFRRSGRITQRGITTAGDELRVNLKKSEIVGHPRKEDSPPEP